MPSESQGFEMHSLPVQTGDSAVVSDTTVLATDNNRTNDGQVHIQEEEPPATSLNTNSIYSTKWASTRSKKLGSLIDAARQILTSRVNSWQEKELDLRRLSSKFQEFDEASLIVTTSQFFLFPTATAVATLLIGFGIGYTHPGPC